ncbi:MAG: ABC transporter permease, partial [Alphaproteobacteria bacterium]
MTRWTLVRRNLTRRKLRTVLTIFAVMTAFLLFGLLKSLERTLDAGSDLAAADRLVVINKINFTQPLPISY